MFTKFVRVIGCGLLISVVVGGMSISSAQNYDNSSDQDIQIANLQVNIGVLLSLSGGLEQWCLPIRQGMEIAASEKQGRNIKLIFEDDRSVDKRITLSAIKKLLEIRKVDLLYTWSSSLAPVLIPLAKQTKTPLVVGAYDPRSIKFEDYVFAGGVNYETMPRDIAKFMDRMGGRRFGIVTESDHWSQGFEGPFRDEVSKLGRDVEVAETLPVGSVDTRALILRLKRAGVDSVLAPLFGETLYSFLKTAKELRFEGRIHVGDGLFEDDIRILGPAAEGVYASQVWLENKELLAKFKARFGVEVNPLQLGLVASGYDFVAHIRAAAGNVAVGTLKGDSADQRSDQGALKALLAESLKSANSDGYLGAHSFGSPPLKTLTSMVVVKDGKYRLFVTSQPTL